MSPSFFENKRYWLHELEGINSNLPKNRVLLKDLLSKNKNGFQTKDGFPHLLNGGCTKVHSNRFTPEK